MNPGPEAAQDVGEVTEAKGEARRRWFGDYSAATGGDPTGSSRLK